MNISGNQELLERRRLLVGSAIQAGSTADCIESTFPIRFQRYFRQQEFWPVFETACRAVENKESWNTARQLLLSYSTPHEVNSKDEHVRMLKQQNMMLIENLLDRGKQ